MGRYKERYRGGHWTFGTQRASLLLGLFKCARVHRGAAQGAAAIQKNCGRIGHASTEYIYVLGLLGATQGCGHSWPAVWYGLSQSTLDKAAVAAGATSHQPPRRPAMSSGPTAVSLRRRAPDPTMSATCQRTPSTDRCILRFSSSDSSSSCGRRRCSQDCISARPAAEAGWRAGKGEGVCSGWEGAGEVQGECKGRLLHEVRLQHTTARQASRPAGSGSHTCSPRCLPPARRACAPATLRTAAPALGMLNK